jgi:hypothetical protein
MSSVNKPVTVAKSLAETASAYCRAIRSAVVDPTVGHPGLDRN